MTSLRLSALAIALASAISVAQAATLESLSTSAENPTITTTGDKTYYSVNNSVAGGNITISGGALTIDHSANTNGSATGLIVLNGAVTNIGTAENPLSTVTIKENTELAEGGDQPPFWTHYVESGTLNINADTFIQEGSGHGLYARGRNGVTSVVNYNVRSFKSTTAFTALHAREGEGAIINVGSSAKPLESFVATRTVGGSGVSLLQVNEGATINIHSKYVELNAFNTRTGGGAIGTGAWGNVNIAADSVKITGSINGDYGGKGASKEDSVFAVNITTGLFEMTGDIYAGATGQGADESHDLSISTASLRKEKINIVAMDANSSLTGNIAAYNKSETNIAFANGGTFTGNITTANYEAGNIDSSVAAANTTAKISLDGAMTYKGDVSMVGASTLNLNGTIDAEESTITSSEASTVNVAKASTFKTVTSTSTSGVNIADSASLAVVSGASSIQNLKSDGTLLLAGDATAVVDTLTGDSTIAVDTLQNKASVATVAQGSTLKARGTSNFNDSNKNSREAALALLGAVDVTSGEVTTLTLDEGAVNNALTAEVKDGAIVAVKETENSKLASLSSTTTLLNLMFRHEMNDLTKRMGELRDSAAGVGTWARVYGSEMEYGKSQRATQKAASVQVGADYKIGDWVVGGAFGYTDGSTTFNLGSSDSDVYSVAAYGSWVADNGLFVDVIGKYTRMSTDITVNAQDGTFDNNGYSLSAEAGWHYPLNDIFFVEPQVEFTYGKIIGDDFTVGKVAVSQDDYDSLIGRAGVRAGAKFPNNKGNVYLRVSGVYDWKGETAAVARAINGAAENRTSEDLGGGWVEYAVGANFNLTPSSYAYVDLERTSGGEVDQNYRWNLGLRYVW